MAVLLSDNATVKEFMSSVLYRPTISIPYLTGQAGRSSSLLPSLGRWNENRFSEATEEIHGNKWRRRMRRYSGVEAIAAQVIGLLHTAVARLHCAFIIK